jgi:hypothetical protein
VGQSTRTIIREIKTTEDLSVALPLLSQAISLLDIPARARFAA